MLFKVVDTFVLVRRGDCITLSIVIMHFVSGFCVVKLWVVPTPTVVNPILLLDSANALEAANLKVFSDVFITKTDDGRVVAAPMPGLAWFIPIGLPFYI